MAVVSVTGSLMSGPEWKWHYLALFEYILLTTVSWGGKAPVPAEFPQIALGASLQVHSNVNYKIVP